MKAIKAVGIGLVVFVILLFVISLLLPSKARVERSIFVKASAQHVFELVNDLEKWEKWSPWKEQDSTIVISYGDKSIGKGASYSWTSENVGSGNLKIIDSKPYSDIQTELNLGMGISFGTWSFTEENEQTKITWSLDADVSSPFVIGKFFGLFMDGMVGPDFENGLKNIKAIAEREPLKPSVEVLTVTINEPQWVLTIKDTCTLSEFDERRTTNLSKIRSFMESQGLLSNASNLTFRHNFDENMIIEVGIPIASEVNVAPPINLIKIAPGTFATATHTGSYNDLPNTYRAIEDWMRQNKTSHIGSPREVYITDPNLESDQTKWYTQVFYRLE